MKPIYLDYMATTPVAESVYQKMLDYLTVDGNFGNPASSMHVYGWTAREAVEKARKQIADAINAKSEEIVFTSGSTESNNLAIKGAARFYQRKGKHIITCKTEHKSVLDVCEYLEGQGFEVTYLPVIKDSGLIDLEQLKTAIRKDTILVSIMYVNNEIGVIQNIPKVAEIVKPHGVVLHVDATQAIGKIPVDVKKCGVDLMSFNAHKIYGPKGIGALYVCQEPKIRLEPQMHGGGQEFGLRSGTLPTHQIVGFGEAVDLAVKNIDANNKHIRLLRERFLNALNLVGLQCHPRGNGDLGKLDSRFRGNDTTCFHWNDTKITLNGEAQHSVPHVLNICFAGIKSNDLIAAMPELAVSTGSACNIGNLTPSHVLKALGLTDEQVHSSVRFSLGNSTMEDEIDSAIEIIKNSVKTVAAGL
jgi:cysteine desulfurase